MYVLFRLLVVKSTQSQLLPKISENLSKLDNEVSLESLKTLLIHKNELTMFRTQVEMVCLMFSSILLKEDDLNSMYLTETFNKKPRSDSNHMVFCLHFHSCRKSNIFLSIIFVSWKKSAMSIKRL
jgi:hypothetical protein